MMQIDIKARGLQAMNKPVLKLSEWNWLTMAWCCLFWAGLWLLVQHWWGL